MHGIAVAIENKEGSLKAFDTEDILIPGVPVKTSYWAIMGFVEVSNLLKFLEKSYVDHMLRYSSTYFPETCELWIARGVDHRKIHNNYALTGNLPSRAQRCHGVPCGEVELIYRLITVKLKDIDTTRAE